MWLSGGVEGERSEQSALRTQSIAVQVPTQQDLEAPHPGKGAEALTFLSHADDHQKPQGARGR